MYHTGYYDRKYRRFLELLDAHLVIAGGARKSNLEWYGDLKVKDLYGLCIPNHVELIVKVDQIEEIDGV